MVMIAAHPRTDRVSSRDLPAGYRGSSLQGARQLLSPPWKWEGAVKRTKLAMGTTASHQPCHLVISPGYDCLAGQIDDTVYQGG